MSNPTPLSPAVAEATVELMNAFQAGENAVARWLVELGVAVDDREARSITRRMGDQAVAGEPVEIPTLLVRRINTATREEAAAMTFALDDVMVRRIWNTTRIAYEIDPDLWEELGDTDDEDKLHPEVFIPRLDGIDDADVPHPEVTTYLPHPNPYLHFPTPILIDHGGPEIQQVTGVVVLGREKVGLPSVSRQTGGGVDARRVLNAHCSTASPACASLSLVFCGRMLDRSGAAKTVLVPGASSPIPDYTFTRIALDFPGDGATTFGELVEHLTTRFTHPHYSPDLGGDPVEDMKQMLRRALASLMYACAEGADYDKRPSVVAKRAVKKRRNLTGGPVKPPEVHGLGFRMGAALRAWRKRAASGEYAAGTGGSRRPHVRRAHFHTFRFGKGRKQRRLRWLSPIPVKMNFTGEAEEVTVVPVR